MLTAKNVQKYIQSNARLRTLVVESATKRFFYQFTRPTSLFDQKYFMRVQLKLQAKI